MMTGRYSRGGGNISTERRVHVSASPMMENYIIYYVKFQQNSKLVTTTLYHQTRALGFCMSVFIKK